ncbi:MAG: helix-turn-helix transcriptional regulator [Pseudomonadota bacterium]
MRTGSATEPTDIDLAEVDRGVGARLRHRRVELGLSQFQVAEQAGVSFQQIQKYEKGANRIGASRLFALGEALGVTVDYFFADFYAAPSRDRGGLAAAPERQAAHGGADAFDAAQASSAMPELDIIGDDNVRRAIRELIRATARLREGGPADGGQS